MFANKILLVEDDRDFFMVLKKRLEMKDYVVIHASDGYEALYKYIEEKPGIIILDVMVPKLNGYEVCRWIRRAWKDTSVPIIMMTGKCEDYDRIKGKVIGANRYLTKPFDLEKIMEEIRDLPRRHI